MGWSSPASNASTSTPTPDEIAPHLSPSQLAIVEAVYDPDSESGVDTAIHAEIAAAVEEQAPDADLAQDLRVLESWDVINESGSYTKMYEGKEKKMGRHKRFALGDNGRRLVDRGALAAEATPRAEWTTEDWVSYPVPLEDKFAELVDEVVSLRAEVKGE